VHSKSVSVALVLLTLTCGCRSKEEPAPAAEESEAAGAEPPAAAEEEPKPIVNSAEGISAITKELPPYPNAKPKGATPWSEPAQFRENEWGSSYEANTSDSMETVLDTYEKAMAAKGWKGQRSFKGMISFEKDSAPTKLVTLVSGPDEKAPGQTLLRVLVVDKVN
jgi:hypothetical protein